MKKMSFYFSALLLVFIHIQAYSQNGTWNDSTSVQWTKGNGSETDPFLIESRENLAYLRDEVNEGNDFQGTFFKLVTNLDFEPENETQFEPIGYGSNSHGFAGVFDGNDHYISIRWYFDPNHRTEDTSYGLFGKLAPNGIIKNLTLTENSVFAAYYKYDIGGLVGTNHGKIINCHVNGRLNGNTQNVGLLVGRNATSGVIDGCSTNGVLMGVDYNGALAGLNEGTITNSYNLGHAEGAFHTGGLVGENTETGKIIHCFNAGSVLGGSYPTDVSKTGGLVAINNGYISECFNSGDIETLGVIYDMVSNTMTGGLSGWNNGTIENCYNVGRVSASGDKSNISGIVCHNEAEGVVEYTYSAARELYSEGSAKAGIHDNFSPNTSSASHNYYDSTLSTLTDSTATALSTTDMIAGSLDGFPSDIWIFEEGTYPQLKFFENNPYAKVSVSSILFYVNPQDSEDFDNFNFVHEPFTVNTLKGVEIKDNSDLTEVDGSTVIITRPTDADSIITLQTVEGDASLSWNIKIIRQVDGRGTEQAPYLIHNNADILYFQDNITRLGISYEGKFLKLMNDLDLDGLEWIPIGNYSNRFAGNFDGNHHIIKNMNVNMPYDDAGFFGVTDYSASVKNLTIDASCKVLGGQQSTGGITGEGYGIYENCHNHATVLGGSFVGGIVGFHFSGKMINCSNSGYIEGTSSCVGGILGGDGQTIVKNCFNMGKVTGYDHSTGGIAGSSFSPIINCYNFGEVTGPENVGGIVGRAMDSIIAYCYNAGAVNGPAATSGGVCGVFEMANGMKHNMKECFYDAQLCPVEDYCEKVDTTLTLGLSTSLLSSGKKFPGFDTSWIFETGRYPTLKFFQENPLSILSSAVAELYSNDESMENIKSVHNDIILSSPENVTWTSSNPAIVGNNGEVNEPLDNQPVDVTLTASLGNYTKSIVLSIQPKVSNTTMETSGSYTISTENNAIIVNFQNTDFQPRNIHLYNIKGQIIDSKRTSSKTCKFSVPSPGLYLVHINDGKIGKTEKIVVNL